MVPKPIQQLAEILKELPSIGPRQATRLAFHISTWGESAVGNLARTLLDLQTIKICASCFLSHQNENAFCEICSNSKRRGDLIAIIEKETDLLSLEKAGAFSGRYLIIGDLHRGGFLEEFQKARLANLKSTLRKLPAGVAEEIIIAVNPTTYGDLGASTISAELLGFTKKISRLGRGIPTGGEIEFADEETLRHAIEGRG